MTVYTTVGKPTTRVEGPEKVTGKALYPADIAVEGTIWGKVLRSPLPHARILSIDTSKAKALPGVHAVLTAADLPNSLVGRKLRDMPVLARDKTRFIGEKVAAVAADSPDLAEEALDLIEVEYEELLAVFDPIKATDPGAPIIHDRINEYIGLPQQVEEPTNRFVRSVFEKGNIAKGFAEADMVFEHSFLAPWVHQGFMEPHTCLVEIDDAGKAQVWVNNKAPFGLRGQVAEAAELEPTQIRINPVYIGGDFGGKGDFMDVPICYFLAKASHRPVKMVMSYVEEFMAGNPRHQAFITIRSGVMRNGTLVAREGHVVFNSGAYGAFKPGVNIAGGKELSGSYRTPNVHITVDNVYTNNVPCGHMRAPGSPQAVFAQESHMDMIAKELGIDPIEFRIKNVLREGDTNIDGHALTPLRGEETLRKGSDASGWNTLKPSPNIGLGIALYDRHTGGGQSTSVVVAETDGTATLRTPAFDQGAGVHTVLRQIVAEELSLPLDLVRVVATDTDAVASDSGVGGSRATHTAGQATYRAAQQLRQDLVERAAKKMGVAVNSVQFKDRKFTTDNSTSSISLSEVASEAKENGKPLSAQVTYSPEAPDETTSFCTQIAEVQVDPETGQVKVLRFFSIHDVGTVFNPLAHQGQIEGGIIMGLGQALMEHLKIEEGQVAVGHFGDYKIPTIQDIPELTTVLLENPAGPTPYQGRGIGELTNVPVIAAIANAVADAVGVRITELPITAEKVLAGIKSKSKAS